MKKKIGAIIIFSLLAVCCLLPILGASASQEYEASVLITTPTGSEEYTGTYLEMRNIVNQTMRSPAVRTEVVLKLHKDVTVTSTSSTLSSASSSNAHLVFDLQGYDLTIDTTAQSSNFIHYAGVGSITIKGKSADTGENSKIISRSRAGFIYSPAANTATTVNISDVDFTFTNMSLGFCDNAEYPHQPMFNLTAGHISMNNVNVLFTGEDAYAVAGSTGGSDISKLHPPFIQANNSATVELSGCSFTDVNTKGIQTYGIYASGATTKVTAQKCNIDAYYAINQGRAAELVSLRECELSASNTVFYGSGTVSVDGSVIHSEKCSVAGNSITINFVNLVGANTIYIDELPSFEYTAPEGYDFHLKETGVFILSDSSVYSTVKLPAYFGDGMVFQRGEPITVRGFCDTDGNTVTVKLGDATAVATVSGGEWSVELPSMEATAGLTLSVYEAEPLNSTEIVYEDIAIGDVFILSGQSNMDYQAKYLEDYEEFLANANNFDNLRGFLVPNVYRHGEDMIGSGSWYKLDETNIGNFSAIGYVMAAKLAAELDDVTIAIVDATYPGSIAKTWIDIDTYIEHFGKSHTDVTTYNAYLDFYKKNGRCPTSASELSAWVGKSYQRVVASCYDSMIAFFDGYSAKATVWYQGEGDLSRISEYPAYFKALTDSFRKTFNNDEMAFVVIQLAPYSANGTSLENFRAMQATLPTIDPYTYVVATSDEGAIYNDPEFINNSDISLIFVHTSVKSPIGLNAADVVLNKIYDIDGANKPLEILAIRSLGKYVTIFFNQPVTTGGVDEILGFELAGADGVFVRANAVIDGITINLYADGVDAPTNVRYGFGSFYIEYQDGTVVVPVGGYSGGSMTATTITFKDIDGKTHTITRGLDEVLRSCIPGNVTSETGAPLGVFSVAITEILD